MKLRVQFALAFAILSFLFCCKKDSQCGACNCVSYADTTCARPPDTTTANSLILGKWYLREVDKPSPPLSGGASGNVYYCDTSEYVIYYANGTILRNGASANYMTGDSSRYQLFVFQDTCGGYYFADKFMFIDSIGNCHLNSNPDFSTYYIPIQICNSVLVIGGFPDINPPDQPYLYIYSRSLQ
jgi:hypothetical protein